MPTMPESHAERRRKLLPKYQEKPRADANAAKFRSSGDWAKIRSIVREEEPLCRDPYGEHERSGEIVPTEEIHHIKPLQTHPELERVRSNLAGLCKRCHRRIDADVRKGRRVPMKRRKDLCS